MELKNCILCDCPLTDVNVTKEHVIPNAIGGRKKVSGFICRDCNSESGSGWDDELARQLQPFSLLLGISRQRGKVPPLVFSTASGGSVQVKSDGTWTIGKPEVKKTTDGNTTTYSVSARDMRDFRRIAKGLREKYPQLRDRSIDDLTSTARDNSTYNADPIGIEVTLGGHKAGRSYVRSALALTYDAGVDPRECDLALDYLKNEDAEACFGYYYERGNDLVVNRPGKLPLHCVHVVGSSLDSTLLGYIELYGFQRMVLCLSESYSGEDFSHSYAIDPITGEELDLSVILNLSVAEVREAYEGKRYHQATYKRAIENVAETMREVGFNRAIDLVSKSAFGTACAKLGIEEGDILTDELARKLASEMADSMMPFIVHNFMSMDVSAIEQAHWKRS